MNKYKYEYYSQKHILQIEILILFLTPCVTNMNKNIIRKKKSCIYSNIRIYLNFLKSLNHRLLLPTSFKIVERYQNLFKPLHTTYLV